MNGEQETVNKSRTCTERTESREVDNSEKGRNDSGIIGLTIAEQWLNNRKTIGKRLRSNGKKAVPGSQCIVSGKTHKNSKQLKNSREAVV